MDAQRDLICFDLLDFDMKHPVFPKNAAYFIVQMSGLVLRQDYIPSFSDNYLQRMGTPSDFDSVNFYSDFTQIVSGRLLTKDIQDAILKFFEISFIPDPAIDLLCAEAFQPTVAIQPSPALKKVKPTKTADSKLSPARANRPKKNKREKNYNSPLIRTHCDNCAEKAVRMKLMKKITTCDVGDLMKFESFWNGAKIEKNLLAAMPPINEIDLNLHGDMINLMEARINAEHHYLHAALPDCLNKIKLDWYDNRLTTPAVINVPDTASDASS